MNILEIQKLAEDFDKKLTAHPCSSQELVKCLRDFGKHLLEQNCIKHGVMQGLRTHSETIALLEKYSTFLCDQGYIDTDWRDEPPYAIDEFMLSCSPAVASEGQAQNVSGGGVYTAVFKQHYQMGFA